MHTYKKLPHHRFREFFYLPPLSHFQLSHFQTFPLSNFPTFNFPTFNFPTFNFPTQGPRAKPRGHFRTFNFQLSTFNFQLSHFQTFPLSTFPLSNFPTIFAPNHETHLPSTNGIQPGIKQKHPEPDRFAILICRCAAPDFAHRNHNPKQNALFAWHESKEIRFSVSM